ncbi:MAG: hypothetical protein JNK66_07175 [Chitinophagales bacterium]|nr:hypothetical protein [Chitinophagales bacterium]
MQVREGYIGNLKTGDATGPLQWEFLERWGETFLETTLELIQTKPLQ